MRPVEEVAAPERPAAWSTAAGAASFQRHLRLLLLRLKTACSHSTACWRQMGWSPHSTRSRPSSACRPAGRLQGHPHRLQHPLHLRPRQMVWNLLLLHHQRQSSACSPLLLRHLLLRSSACSRSSASTPHLHRPYPSHLHRQSSSSFHPRRTG